MSKVAKEQKIFSRHFPAPKFLQMPYSGLSISDSFVRFVNFKESKKGLVLGDFGKVELPQGMVERGYIHQKEELAEILKKIKKEYKMDFVKTALPEDKVYLFKVDIPWVEKEEIRDALELKVEENVPVKVEESVFDYSVVENNKAENKISLVVGVCPLKTVEAYLEVFKDAELTPLTLSLEPQAISQAIVNRKDKGTYLVVNIEKTRTSLFIVSGNIVHFTFSFSALSDLLDKKPSLNINSQNPTEEKNLIKAPEKVSPQEDSQSKGFIPAEGSFWDIKEEIGKIKDYWHNHRIEKGKTDEKIEKILLVGEVGGLENLANVLRKQMDTEVEIADVWANAFSVEKYIPPLSLEESLEFASAIGLALPGGDN